MAAAAVEKHYSTKELAELLSVDARTLRRWIREGRLRAAKAGDRLWRVSESNVQEFLSKREKTQTDS